MRQMPIKYNVSCKNSKNVYCDNDEQYFLQISDTFFNI
jgi:hypothetical protein